MSAFDKADSGFGDLKFLTQEFQMLAAPLYKSGIQDRRLFAALVFCICLAGFDATATVQHIASGVAVELNPVMRYFLDKSWITFFWVKVSITTLGLWVCYVTRHRPLGRAGIWFAVIVYQLLALYHIYIFRTEYPH